MNLKLQVVKKNYSTSVFPPFNMFEICVHAYEIEKNERGKP